jgi:hypothetical protein
MFKLRMGGTARPLPMSLMKITGTNLKTVFKSVVVQRSTERKMPI